MSRKTILIGGAGAGGGNNLIRSIRHSGYPVRIIGTNVTEYALGKSTADKNYLLPPASDSTYLDALNTVVDKEGVDLIIPQNDPEVEAVSEIRDKLHTKTYLPSKEAVRTCRDKFKFHTFCEENSIPVAKWKLLDDLENVEQHFKDLGGGKLWCRMRGEAGSKGSLPVTSPEQVRFWVNYWEDMRGAHRSQFLLQEYLPGRDFAFQSVWKNGELVIAKTCERIEYIFGKYMPAGTSSSPQVGRLLFDKRVADVCIDAIKKIDPNANGNFCVDLKEDANGDPHITEINIGRFFMITNIFDLAGKHNTAGIHLKCAFDEPVNISEEDKLHDIGEDVYLLRDVDIEPCIIERGDLDTRYERVQL